VCVCRILRNARVRQNISEVVCERKVFGKEGVGLREVSFMSLF